MRNFTISSMLLGIAMTMSVSAFAITTSIPEDYRVEPAPGTTVEAITEITVVNREGDEITNSGNIIYINDAEYSTTPTTDYNKVTFVLDKPVTEAGTYEIYIPSGRVDDGWFGVDEFIFTLYVSNSEQGGDNDPVSPETVIPKGFTLSPVPGSDVEFIQEFKLTYDDDYSDLSLDKKSILVDGQEMSVNGYGGWGELTITLISKITEPGVHTIVFPVGTFTIDSLDKNELFSFTLTVTGTESPEDPGTDLGELAGIPEDFSVIPAADATIESLSEIRIEDEYYGYIRVPQVADLYIDGESVEYTAEVEGDDDEILVITLNKEITAPGLHTIQLPEGFFRYYIYKSEPFGWTVTVKDSGTNTGINNIEAEIGETEVFTIEGLRVTEMKRGNIYIVRSGDKIFKTIGK